MKLYYDRDNGEQNRREKRRFLDAVLQLVIAWMLLVLIGSSIRAHADGFDKHVVTAILIMFTTFFGTLIYLNYNTYRKNKQ
jgi:hypothetical protein